ncbi:MAG: prepilin peptidase [Patescibacteria group bacterium]
MEFFLLGIFFLGSIVGSFLNVVVFRFGFQEAPRSRSACQACGHTLQWFELFPIASFIFLRGKCRACGSALSPQYPLMELSLGILFVLTMLAVPFPLTLVGILFFASALVFWAVFLAITVYDLKHTLVPSVLAWWLIGSAVAMRGLDALLFSDPALFVDGVIGGVLSAFFIGIVVLVTRGRGMGAGDIYIAGAIGILFGLSRGFEVLLIAFWIGALVGIALIGGGYLYRTYRLPPFLRSKNLQRGKGGFRMKSEVPFVPFLFLATCIGMFTHFSPLALIATYTGILWP